MTVANTAMGSMTFGENMLEHDTCIIRAIYRKQQKSTPSEDLLGFVKIGRHDEFRLSRVCIMPGSNVLPNITRNPRRFVGRCRYRWASRGGFAMRRGSRQAGQATALVLVGLLVLAIPVGVTLAQALAAPSTSTTLTPTPPPILNLTDTPTDTPTAAPTDTPTPTATPTPMPTEETPTDSPGPDDGDESGVDQTIVVDDDANLPTGDCPNAEYVRIQAAVDYAEPGDTVQVCAGTYLESVTVPTANLTIHAGGNATIDGGPDDAVHITASNVTIERFHLRSTNRSGIWVEAANHVVVRHNSLVDYRETANKYPNIYQYNDGIRLNKTNESIVRNNTVTGFDDDQISVGEGTDLQPRSDFPRPGTQMNASSFNIIENNTVTGMPGSSRCGIFAERKSKRTVIRNNTAINASANPWTGFPRQMGFGICTTGNHTDIIGNRMSQNAIGVWDVAYGTDVIGNTIVNGAGFGVNIMRGNGDTRVVDNHISGRYGDFFGRGISVGNEDVTGTEIHRNVIYNNSGLGIYHDNGSVVVNATNNIWACGGPSSGLEDPLTGRIANGSGDGISESNEPGVSNIHYDPFRALSSCPEQTSSPTSTSTPTPTPTPTATPTPPPAGGGDSGGGDGRDDGGGGSGEMGGNSGGADSLTSSGSDDTGETDGDTVTSPTETATVTPSATPQETATDTPTPTPVVEPGFGVLVWVIGSTLLGGLLAIRRRLNSDSEKKHD